MDNGKNKYLIDTSISLVDAIRALYDTGKRIVFLVDNGKLKGSLTYGDVSRWILKGNSLDLPAKEAARMDPISIHQKDIQNADELFLNSERLFSGRYPIAIPVVDSEDNIIDILFHEKGRPQFDLPVVMMAGGKGTRLYPYTKILPKPLIPIGDIPISEYIANRFYENGFRKFYFILNYKKNMIKAYFNEMERPYEITFIDEDIPLGTGGGLSLLKGHISSTFILTNCDSFIDEDYSGILKAHKENKNPVTMICSNQGFEVPYGIIEKDDDNHLLSLREKPCLRYLTNTGTYIVEPEVIDMIETGKSIGFPDVIQMIQGMGKEVGIYTLSDNAWFDMGQFDSMSEMKKKLNVQY